MLPPQGVRVQSQVGALGSCMPLGVAKGEKKSRITEAEDKISEVEDRMVNINEAERK